METAHRLGMKTTATMMFGHVETLEERIEHLLHLRELQDRTRRLHRLHRLDLPAGEHRARRRRADVVPVPADARGRAHRARQLPERPGLVGDAGREDRPGVAALRRERLRQPDDRGERGLGGRLALPADARRRSRARSRRPASSRSGARWTTRSSAIRTAGRSRRRSRARPSHPSPAEAHAGRGPAAGSVETAGEFVAGCPFRRYSARQSVQASGRNRHLRSAAPSI